MKNVRVNVEIGNKSQIKSEIENLGQGANVKLDLSQANQSLKELVDAISNLTTKLSSVDASKLKGVGTTAKETSKEVKGLTESLDKITGKESKVTITTNAKNGKKEITEFGDAFASTTKVVEKNGEVIATSTTTNFKKAEETFSNFSKRITELGSKGVDVSNLTKEFDRLKALNTNAPEKEIKELGEAIKTLESDFKKLSEFKFNQNLKINENLFNGKLGLDQVEKLKNELNSIKLDNLNNGMANFTASFNRAITSTAELKAKAKETENGYRSVSNALDTMQTKLNLMSKTNALDDSAIKRLQRGIDDLRGTTDKSSSAFKNLVAQFKEADVAQSQIKSLETAIRNLKSQMAKAEKLNLVNTSEFREAQQSLTTLENALTKVRSTGQAMDISTPLNRARSAADSLKGSMSGIRTVAGRLGSIFGGIAQQLGIFLGMREAFRALVSSFKDGLQYVKDLDRAFFDIQATMSITKGEFEDVTAQVQQMAQGLGTSATAVMDVVKTYANASTTMEEVLAKSKPSVMLSNITGMSTAEVTKAVNAGINAFRMSTGTAEEAATSAERYGDVLVKVSQNMQYDFADGVRQLIDGVRTSGNVMDEAGLSYEEYISLLGSMIEATGRSGSELANGMKMIVARAYSIKSLSEELGITTAELNKGSTALKKYGIEVVNLDGSVKPFGEVLAELKVKWDGMSESERNYVAESVAGNRQRSIFISMMDNMAKATELHTQAMGSQGTMMQVQEMYMDSLEGKMGRLKATSQEFWSNFINSGLVKGGVDALNGLISVINKMSDTFGSFATNCLVVADALTLVVGKVASIKVAAAAASGASAGFWATIAAAVPVVGACVATLTLLASAVVIVANHYEDVADRIEKANTAISKFKENQSKLETSKSLLDEYTQLNKQLENVTLSASEREAIENRISEIVGETTSINENLNGVLESNNYTLEEQLEYWRKINEEQEKANAKELNDGLEKESFYEKEKKDLQTLIKNNKEMKKWLEDPSYSNEEKKQFKEQIEYQDQLILSKKEEIDKHNEIVDLMGEENALALGRNDIELDGSYLNYIDVLKSQIKSIEIASEDAAKKITLIPKNIPRSTEDVEAWKEITDAVNDIDFKMDFDLSETDLSYISDEFLGIASAVAAAHSELEKFTSMYNTLGNNLDLMGEMKEDLEANGTFSEEMIDKILASGNADLIALLDDEGNAYQNLINLIGEYTQKQEEAKQKAIEKANAEATYQDQLEESYKAEKQKLEELYEMESKFSETSINEKGLIEDPNGEIKQLTAIADAANGAKVAVVELNGQKVAITYDSEGYYQSMSNVKEVSDGVYASLGLLDGATVAFTIDESGETVVSELTAITEGADGTLSALTEIDGQTYSITFDAENNIIAMDELKKSGEELVKGLEVIDGKTYRITIDAETGKEQLEQVTQRLDGYYEYVDTSSGHPIKVVVDGDGVVIGQLDGVTGAIINVEQWKQNLNGSSIKVNVDGTEQTVSNLGQITEGANGTFTAIGTLNGKPVKITFNNKGEIVGDLVEVTGAANDTKQAADDVNGNPLKPKVEGAANAVKEADMVTGSWSNLRSQAGTVTIKTVHENITRNIVENGVKYTTTGSKNGYATMFSMDSNEFAPVEATQDVVIHATPVVDTSEVEAFSAEGGSGDSSGGGEGFSAPLPDEEMVQPFAVDSPVKDLRDATGNKSTYTMSSNTAEIIKDTQTLKEATDNLASSVKGLTQEIVKNNSAKKEEYTNLEMTLDRYYKFNDVLDDYDNILDKIEDRKVNASAKETIDLTRQEIEVIQDKINVLSELKSEQQRELNETRNILTSNGFLIDSYGNLTNSQERLSDLVSWANKSQSETNKSHVEYLKNMVDLYTKLANDSIPGTINSIRDLQNEINNTAIDQLTKLRNKLVDAIKEERKTQKQQEIDVLDNRIEELKKQIADLEDEDADLYSKKAKLEAELAKWEKDDSAMGVRKVKELQEKLDDLNKEIKKEALNKQIEEIESTKDTVEETYDKMLEDKAIYEEANKLITEHNQKEMLRLLQQYCVDYTDIGKLWGSSLSQAFMDEIQIALDSLTYLKSEAGGFGNTNAPTTATRPTQTQTTTSVSTSTTSSSSSSGSGVNRGSKVKVTDTNATIYVNSTTNSGSGTWKGAGISPSDTLYVVNTNGDRVALARTQNINDAIGWIDKKKIQAFASGGYTGEFTGGRLAMLHAKEYVLNSAQTEAWLKLVPILTDLVKTPFLDMAKLVNGLANNTVDNSEVIITNNIEINNSSDVDMEKTNKGFEELVKEQLRKYGKIKK